MAAALYRERRARHHDDGEEQPGRRHAFTQQRLRQDGDQHGCRVQEGRGTRHARARDAELIGDFKQGY